MIVVGLSTVLHDGSAGVHLLADTCPKGCYEQSFADAPFEASDSEKGDWLRDRVASDVGERVSVEETDESFGLVRWSRDPAAAAPEVPDPKSVTFDG